MKFFFFISATLLLFSCTDPKADTDPSIETPHIDNAAPANIPFTLLAQYPHDTSAYTQGLEFHDGKLYEGTGDNENSSLRITNVKTGAVVAKHMMGSADIFGEGITIFQNKIYQLTWQSNKVYQYDLNNINTPVKTFSWPYEGWGITHNDSNLIVSDGSANIYFVSPNTFNVLNTVSVKDNNGEVQKINELEYVDGFIYANVWETNRIVKIEPESGKVIGQMFIKDFLKSEEVVAGRTDVLNGLAWNPDTKTMFITGKRWPKMFEIRLN